MKLKTLEQFESKDPCECGGNCGCGGKPVNEKFNFSKKEVEKAANLIASAIAQADMVKTKVHHLEYDKGRGAGFDISIDGEESAGGSYVVKDNGDVVNAAIGNSHTNAVYNTIGNKSIADVFINMEKYESNTVTESFVAYTENSKGEYEVVKVLKDQGAAKAWRKKNAYLLDDDSVDVKSIGTTPKKDWDKTHPELATESVVTEAKKYKFKELAKAWEFVYGEEMEDEYEGFYQEVVGKYKNKVTKEDIAEIWNNVYGEDIAVEYDGFFKSIKENLNEAINLERFNNIEEANADGTISDDEDDAVENMLVDVEYMVDELVNYIKVETEKIGGRFRSPGMEAQCLKLVKETFKKHKVRL